MTGFSKEGTLKFKNIHKKDVPITVYADFECLNKENSTVSKNPQ